jgi:tetratricopeptide (TPR) repeat protein
MEEIKRAPAAAAPAIAMPAQALPRTKWEEELLQVESRLTADPESLELRFRRGYLLSELGRFEEARSDYVKVLERESHHRGSLNNLGSVLVAMGKRSAAQIAYRAAVLRHPGDPLSRVNFGNFLLEESVALEIQGRAREALRFRREAREQYEQALRADENYEKAHEGLSYVLRELGEEEQAAWHRRQAFRKRYLMPLVYRGEQAPLPVLLFLSPYGGNVKLMKFLDDRVFQITVVLPEYYDFNTPLPPHRLVINSIGDAEVSPGALRAAQSVLALTTAPVINSPAAVLATGRSENAARAARLPGVVTPVTATVPRALLATADAATVLAEGGFTFPLLLRAPGFHTGMNFVRVEDVAELPSALAELPGDELIVMQYLDARGAGGKSRKYRVMTIAGRLYPVHLAVSSHWKIHYFTAEMADSPEYRAEDAAFLEDMPGVLGAKAMEALTAIQAMLGLDYGGIDFGLSREGEILLFEANATMVVNPPEPDERWNYRRPAYEQIEAAIQNMLRSRMAGR